MRLLTPVLACAVACAAAGCGGQPAAAPTPTASAITRVAPAYDPSLPPAQAVLALVPHAATTLRVTDFDQVRAEYGASPGDDGFWKRAERSSPLLSTGLLRSGPGALGAASLAGIGADDVAWEAHYSGPDASATGWVLGFRAGTDLGAVRRATTSGTGPLAGGVVDPRTRVVASQSLPEGDAAWSDLAALVPDVAAESTYVARGCLPGDTDGVRLEPLEAYAVSFGQLLATAYLGPGRSDLFERMRLGERVGDFAQVFTRGAADPATGRIGFTMTDPVEAAQQALRSKLPFALCAD